MKCKNCEHVFEGNFCNYCGQSADTHPINLHFLWHDIQHGLMHIDKGIFYTIKELFIRPGHSIRDFINGKRVKHFKPISLVIVLAAFYGFLYHYFDVNVFISKDSNNTILFAKINHWISNHYSWYILAMTPLFSIGTYICFIKQNYNYFEYLILNSFKASQRLVIHIITFPLLLYFSNKESLQTFINILYGLDVLLILWTNVQFFNELNKVKVLLLSILSHIIMIILSLIIMITSIAILNYSYFNSL